MGTPSAPRIVAIALCQSQATFFEGGTTLFSEEPNSSLSRALMLGMQLACRGFDTHGLNRSRLLASSPGVTRVSQERGL